MIKLLVTLLTTAAIASSASAGTLSVDFNSNQNGGGDSAGADPQSSVANHNQSGWESYHANHEVPAEFSTGTYGAITVTPAWPNTTDNRVQQSIDRGGQNVAGDVTGNHDNSWAPNGTLIADAGDLNLVTDFIGIDTRTGNGGNGNWDGALAGTPTYMTLSLGGLNAAPYNWTSYHHDTEHVHTFFQIELSTDGGSSYENLGQNFYMTDGFAGGNPDSAIDGAPFGTQTGLSADALPSTVNFTFTANGTDDVVLRFAPLSGTFLNAAGATAVHNQIWGMNGFVLEEVPEPSSGLLALFGLALVALRRRR